MNPSTSVPEPKFSANYRKLPMKEMGVAEAACVHKLNVKAPVPGDAARYRRIPRASGIGWIEFSPTGRSSHALSVRRCVCFPPEHKHAPLELPAWAGSLSVTAEGTQGRTVVSARPGKRRTRCAIRGTNWTWPPRFDSGSL